MQVVVVQCKSCRTIVGDTAHGARVVRDLGIVLNKLAETAVMASIRSSRSGPVQMINCANCGENLGHFYIQNTDKLLNHKYVLMFDLILSYKIELPEPVVAATEPAVETRLGDLERLVTHIYKRME